MDTLFIFFSFEGGQLVDMIFSPNRPKFHKKLKIRLFHVVGCFKDLQFRISNRPRNTSWLWITLFIFFSFKRGQLEDMLFSPKRPKFPWRLKTRLFHVVGCFKDLQFRIPNRPRNNSRLWIHFLYFSRSRGNSLKTFYFHQNAPNFLKSWKFDCFM